MQKAYNPQTGEYVFLVNNEWVKPSQVAENPETKEKAYLVGNEWQVIPALQPAQPEQPVAQTAQPQPSVQPLETIIDPEAAMVSGAQAEPAPAETPSTPRVRTARDQELAMGQELTTGVKGAGKQVANLPAIFALQQNADIAGFRQKELFAFDAIDAGQKITPQKAAEMGVDYARVLQYERANPQDRQQFKDFNQKAVGEAQIGVQEGLKLYAKFSKEMEQYKGRTPDFTDIETAKDFGNWLAFNFGSGAVQLAPVIISTLTLGGVGGFTVGTAMASQETLGNRLDFILKKTATLSPEQQADAVENYLRETGNVNAAVAMGSGLLDIVGGPVGTILRKRLAKEATEEVVKYASKKEAATAALKRTPKEVGEEFLTGGAQEATQIAGERVLGEQEGPLLSKENAKRLLNASTAEAAGALSGSAFNVSTAVGKQAAQEYIDRKLAEAEDQEKTRKNFEDNKDQILANFHTRVAELVAQGKSEDEAVRMAGNEVAESGKVEPTATTQEAESGVGGLDTGAGEPGVSVPSGQEAGTAVTGGIEGGEQRGVGTTGAAVTEPGGGEGAAQPTLSPAYTAVKALKDKADALIKRSIELTEKMRSYTSADKRGRLVTPRHGSKRWKEWQAVQDENERLINEWNNADIEFRKAKEAYLNDPANADEIARLQEEKRAAAEQTQTSQEAKDLAEDLKVAPGEPVETTTEAPAQQTINPNTGLAPQGKPRGRKPLQLTPEQQQERQKKRTQAAGVIRDAVRQMDRAEKDLAEPLPDAGEAGTMEEAAQIEEAYNARQIDTLVDVLKVANDPQHRNNAAGKKAKALLADPNINARNRQIAEAKYNREKETAQPSKAFEGATNDTQNDAFRQFNTLGQALRYILNSGNAFEKLIARRLLPFVKDYTFIVVTDPNQIPKGLQGAWAGARGLHVEGGRRIFINAIEGQQDIHGLTNTVVLHEALHAATVSLLNTVVSAEQDKTGAALAKLSPQLDQSYTMLLAIMEDVQARVKQMKEEGTLPPAIQQLVDIGAFDDIKEFVSYGLTQPEMQDFLISLPSKLTGQVEKAGFFGKSLFTSFIKAIMKMFGLGKQFESAFLDLAVVTDQLLKSPETNIQKALGSLEANAAKSTAKKAKVDKTTQKLEQKLLRSNNMSDLNTGIVGLLKQTRSFSDGVKLMRAIYKSGNIKALRTALPFFSTSGIGYMFGDQINNLKVISSIVNEMASKRLKMLRDSMKLVPELHKFNKDKGAGAIFGDLLNLATLFQVNPAIHKTLAVALVKDQEMQEIATKLADPKTTAKEAAALKGKKTRRERELTAVFRRWEALRDRQQGKAHELFEKLRKAYEDNFLEHQRILEEQVRNSPVPGDAADASTPKGKMMANIVNRFQEAKKLSVYFPLMRYGQYWIREGKGADSGFYMFESETARNVALEKIAERINAAYAPGAKKSVAQLIEDGTIDSGNTIMQMRNVLADSSKMLREMFDLIDKQGVADKEALKDQIYQMYLMTLPESDIRKKFTKRTGKAGFSSDYIRNYVVSMHTAANQLSRLEHSPDLRNSIAAAYAELQNNPDKVKLATVVDEVTKRAMSEIQPNSDDSLMDAIARSGNQAVFYYMLTSIKSALIQSTQIAIVGLPVLMARYNPAAVLSTAARYMFVFNKLTMYERDENGNVVGKWFSLSAPSLINSSYVAKNKLKDQMRRAWHEANDKNDLFMTTLVADTTSRGRMSTERFTSRSAMGLRFLSNFMSGAFHHVERMTREVMYMSAFELEYKKLKSEGVSDTEAERRAIDVATNLTNESLYNYSQYNKPRAMKKGVGRLAFQFALFPMYTASFLLRNFYNMVRVLPKESRKEASIKFFGVMGMTFMFAGATGLPFYSMFIGLAEGLREIFRPSGEEPEDEAAREMYDESATSGDPLAYRSLDLWFRGWFIPHYFGAGSDIAVAVGLDDKQAKMLQRAVEVGPLSALTDVDISGSTSMADIANANLFIESAGHLAMYMLDPAGSARDASSEALIEQMLGPLGSIGTQVTGAYDDWRRGEVGRGMEKLSPAAFRGYFTAGRLKSEGLKTPGGDQVMDKEYYTTGKLLAQAMGFGSTEANAVQKANFLAKKVDAKIMKQRSELLQKAANAAIAEDTSPEKEAAIDNEIRLFNLKNPVPGYLIVGSDLADAIHRRTSGRANVEQGLKVSPAMRKAFGESIEGSRSE